MNELSVLSYNIWFENTLETERLSSLIATIYFHNPDVVCLQEVRPNIYKILLQKLKEYKYHYPKKIAHSYGCVIFSKHPISKFLVVPFDNSSMNRELIIAKIDYPYQKMHDQGVIVSTTHFESVFKRNVVNRVKIEQFSITQQTLDNVADEYSNIIFCGDCNIMAQEEDCFFADDSEIWKDCWELKGNDENKNTYDGENNIYLMLKNHKKYKSRFDRILFRGDNFELLEFKLIKGVDGFSEPSDHFGVLSKFKINYAESAPVGPVGPVTPVCPVAPVEPVTKS